MASAPEKWTDPAFWSAFSAAGRTAKILWCLRIGLASAAAAALFNCWLYLVRDDWRLAGLAAGLLVCGGLVLPGLWLTRREKPDAAGFFLLASIVTCYACGLAFLQGLDWLLVPSGLLVLTLASHLSFPGRFGILAGFALLFIAAAALLTLSPPWPRYDAAASPALVFSTAAATLAVLGTMILMLHHAYQHITTIRQRLLASFALLVILPSAAIITASALSGLASIRSQVIDQLTSVATLKAADIANMNARLKSDLGSVLSRDWTKRCALGLLAGEDAAAVCPGGTFALREHFAFLMHRMNTFDEISLLNGSGQVVASTDPSQEGRGFPVEAHSHAPGQTAQVLVEGRCPLRPAASGPSVSVLMPVTGEDGRFAGTLAGLANMAHLDTIMSERAGLGRSGETYLIEPSGLLLTPTIFPGFIPGKSFLSGSGLAKATQSRGQVSGLFTDYRGVSVVGVYYRLDELNLILAAEQDQMEAFRPAFVGLALNLGVALVSLLLALFGAVQITKSISTPLAELAAAAKLVAAGDLSITSPAPGQDEVGDLARAFNSMTAKLKELFASLEHRIARLREADRQMKAYTLELEEQIQEREAAEQRLAHQAYHDSLTGLPNRALLLDRLRLVVERSKRRDDYLYAVLFLDMDRFKVVNDSLGHDVGDQLLILASKRMIDCVRKLDTVARLSGDEFVIVLEEVASWKEVIRVTKRLRDAFERPFSIEGNEIHSSASIGIVLSPTNYDRPEDLLRNADIAMRRAKSKGRGRFKVFHSQMLEEAMGQLKLENELRRAIRNGEFVLHYQVIVDLETGMPAGVEALVRWQPPGGKLLPPSEFILLAEETGLILPIGAWVMRQACAKLAEWNKNGLAGGKMMISVNLSPKQFAAPGLVDQVAESLSVSGLAPACLKIEITESAVMENAQAAVNTLARLKGLGARLSIDDFGTGYSSLNYLQRFPIDYLKIDRSFVSRMLIDPDSLEIVRTVIALAHALRLKVIAEGVETREQLEKLRELGTEYGQGYYFSKPLVEEEVLGLLRQMRRTSRETAGES